MKKFAFLFEVKKVVGYREEEKVARQEDHT